MKTNFIHTAFVVLSTLAVCTACSVENDYNLPQQQDDVFAIYGEIVGADVASRAVVNQIGSYTRFLMDDKIGFYSFHEPGCNRGNKEQHQENGDDTEYLKNECLTYANTIGVPRFESATLTNVAMNTLGNTFAYFPYSDTSAPDGYVKWDKVENRKDSAYVKLATNDHYIHIFDGNNVVDLLTAESRQGQNVNYQFRHHLSMVLIYLDEGFSRENNPELKVCLTEQIIGAHVTRVWYEHNETELFPVTIDRVPLDYTGIQGHSSFTAKRVDNYTLPGTSTGAYTVYPVVLPYGSKIDHIELKDVKGNLQKVSAVHLEEMQSGWIYPVVVCMDSGLHPTVYPHEIIPWGDTETLVVPKLPGIYSSEQFEDWLALYNNRVDNLPVVVDDEDYTKLLKYGEYDNQKGWTFYLRDSIDCSGIEAPNGYLISKLPDGVTFDGGRKNVNHLRLSKSANDQISGMGLGFIGEIAGGTLRNLRMEHPEVTYPDSPDALGTGCIAAQISDGQVINCTVRQAVMVGNHNTGVLAGIMSAGLVHDCKFHGIVQSHCETGVEKAYLGVLGRYTKGAQLTQPIINYVNFIALESTGN